jgi:hypothetical protein
VRSFSRRGVAIAGYRSPSCPYTSPKSRKVTVSRSSDVDLMTEYVIYLFGIKCERMEYS